ncbi:MAG: DnaJ domain-containing protein [Candidatus Omnitrophota bacterium]
MNDHKTINEARMILGLGESATIPEIKEAYRKLSLKYHPDKCKEKDKKKYEEKFKALNAANEILVEYCLNYKFSFKEAYGREGRKGGQMSDHLKRFYDGWWGDIGEGRE